MKLVGGIILLMIGAFMTLGFALSEAEHGAAVQLFAWLVAGALPGGLGARMLWQHYKGTPRLTTGMAELRRLTQQSEILKLAERRGGRLTVVEVVAETALPAEAAEEMLGEYVRQGLAEPEVTDKGLMVYVFADVQQLGDKDKSRGLLED